MWNDLPLTIKVSLIISYRAKLTKWQLSTFNAQAVLITHEHSSRNVSCTSNEVDPFSKADLF